MRKPVSLFLLLIVLAVSGCATSGSALDQSKESMDHVAAPKLDALALSLCLPPEEESGLLLLQGVTQGSLLRRSEDPDRLVTDR